jgi:hypothetical protein
VLLDVLLKDIRTRVSFSECTPESTVLPLEPNYKVLPLQELILNKRKALPMDGQALVRGR